MIAGRRRQLSSGNKVSPKEKQGGASAVQAGASVKGLVENSKRKKKVHP